MPRQQQQPPYRRSVSNRPAKSTTRRSSFINNLITDLESRVDEAQKELNNLKALLMLREAEAARRQNSVLRSQLREAKMKLSSAETRQEESGLRASELSRKVEAIRDDVGNLNEKFEAVEAVKGVVEEEMKKLRVESQQWQVAAEAAAQLVVDNNGGANEVTGYVEGRRDSIDGIFEMKLDDFGGIYRRGFGFRVFGDLWKMKWVM